MDLMQQLTTEVGGKVKAKMHNLKEDLEEVVEEALLKRRSRTTSDGSSILTTVSSSASSEISTSTSSSGSGEYVVDELPVKEEAGGDGDDEKKKQEDSVYFDKNEGTVTEIRDIQRVMGGLIDATQVAKTPKDKISASAGAIVGSAAATDGELEESDEEVVELEFETAVKTMHAHDGYNMFCPNCSSRITKVVLRRKIRRSRIPAVRRDLVGCASCFSIFVSCGERLNPFRIFRADGDGKENNQLQAHPVQSGESGCNPLWLFRKERDEANDLTSPLLSEAETPEESSFPTVTQKPRDEAIDQGKGYDWLWPFRKGRDDKNALPSTVLAATEVHDSTVLPPTEIHNSTVFATEMHNSTVITTTEIHNSTTTVTYEPRDESGEKQHDEGGKSVETSLDHPVSIITAMTVGQHIIGKIENNISVASVGSILQTPPLQGPAENGNVIIDVDKPEGEVVIPSIEPPTSTEIVGSVITATVAQPSNLTEPGSSRSLEIVKSVVYGGLMESIASLSVVSSAAASDATTLNIVVLGLANLVGGLVVLAHNLKDLRYGENGQANEQKYKEELGRKEHFPLHATVAILSYIIFGLIPPVMYGFTFRETNDRDYKMLAVAAASLLCIFILAIAKAYTRGEHKFSTYFKTVSYYLTSAVVASGIAFAVGDLAKKVVEKYGWLDPAAPVKPEPSSFQSTSWASY